MLLAPMALIVVGIIIWVQRSRNRIINLKEQHKNMEHLELFFKSIFIDNMVFATFLGMCSYLAVSKKVSTAVGLGAAVIFVLAITVPLNWLLDQYILQEVL